MNTTTDREVETISLGALAMRLGERLDRLVTTQRYTAAVEVKLGRDTAKFINDNYSAEMVWNEAYKSWTTNERFHRTPDGSEVVIRVMVKGSSREL